MIGIQQLVQFQVEHSVWALRELIRHARTLAPADLEKNLGIGPGSFRENLVHTIEAMVYFGENFAGRDYDPARYPEMKERSKTLDGLSELLDIAHERLRAAMVGACAGGARERVLWPNASGGYLPTAAAIAQVFDHSTLHRAQCVNMLKTLGIDPAPDLDPMTFLAAGGTSIPATPQRHEP
jgi:uncharacterized damage-inducible protein DinB